MQRLILIIQLIFYVLATPTFAQSSGSLKESQQAYDKAEKLSDLDRNEEAINLRRRALAIREKWLGRAHPLVADCHYKIGESFRKLGDLEQAEQAYRRALKIRQDALGEDHIDVADTQMALAIIYSKQGDHTRAEEVSASALRYAEKAVGPEHPRLASILRKRAIIYRGQTKYQIAQPLLLRALKLLETTRLPDIQEKLKVLNALAVNYYDLGDIERPESIYQKSLILAEATYGQYHRLVAISLINLAEIYWTKKQYDRARPLAERALNLFVILEGWDYRDLIEPLLIYIRILIAQGHTQDAWPLLQRLAYISDQRMRHEGVVLPEARLSGLVDQIQLYLDVLCSSLRTQLKNRDLQRLALSTALLQKGRSLEQAAATSQAIYMGLPDSDRRAYDNLRNIRSQLARFYTSNSKLTASSQTRQKELEEQADAIEHELSQRSAPLRVRRAVPALNQVVDRVAAALPPDVALVEIVSYRLYSFAPPEVSEDRRALYYLAFVLKPSGEVAVADLGPAQTIDSAATELLTRLASPKEQAMESARAVFHGVMEPLLPLLGWRRHLFLSPDGLLNLLPFAALHDGHAYMLDEYQLSYLTSGRDLLSGNLDIRPGRTVVAMADPTFSSIHSEGQSASSAQWENARGLRLESLPALPGTRLEAISIQGLLPAAQLFLGREARKSVLLGLSAPGILHVATHGVFIDREGSPASTSRGVVLKKAQPLANPLLRSALVMAADSLATDHVAPELVTALEIAGMNLWGTQLVVLSACDTGRGEVRLGQGVYGLRRAVLIAGAETLVTSLWKVNDQGTQALMGRYYQELLGGASRAEAMRKAAQAIRKLYPQPYYWASFVVIGRDAPLRSIP